MIDSAIKEVETSNTQLVSNMEQISSIVDKMTKSISHSDGTTHAMLSKYAETATNINSIEHIVEGLMTELGIGGFMGVEDLRAGMKVMLLPNDNSKHSKAYRPEFISCHQSEKSSAGYQNNLADADYSRKYFVLLGIRKLENGRTRWQEFVSD